METFMSMDQKTSQDRTKTIKTLRSKYRSDSLWSALDGINEKWLLMKQEIIF